MPDRIPRARTRYEPRRRARRQPLPGHPRSAPRRPRQTHPSDVGTTEAAELWLYGVVGGYWWRASTPSPSPTRSRPRRRQLYVRIHSPGGDASTASRSATCCATTRPTVTRRRRRPRRLRGLGHRDRRRRDRHVPRLPDDAPRRLLPDLRQRRRAARATPTGSASRAQNYAGVYAERAGGTADEWREIMPPTTAAAPGTPPTRPSPRLADRVGTTIVATGSPPTHPTTRSTLERRHATRAARPRAARLRRPPRCPRPLRPAAAPKPPTASAGGSIHHSGNGVPPWRSATSRSPPCGKLGLPEDADEATIVAALDEALEERAEPATPHRDGRRPRGHDPRRGRRPAVAARPGRPGRRGSPAAAGRAPRPHDQAQAIADGKITPARKEHWVERLDRRPRGHRDTLKALAPGLVPVEERGHDQQSTVASSAYDELYATEQKGA
jgi:hypothetical protein